MILQKRRQNMFEKKVTIFSDRREQMNIGDTVTLTSKLEGFEDCSVIVYEWECDKGDGFKPIEGATGDSYSFGATVETMSWAYRLSVLYR